MLRKTGILVLALGSLAAPLQAAEHYVLMMGIGYFPDQIYPDIGDTVRFVNESDLPMSAVATDQSWSTGLLLPAGQTVITVAEGMTQTFGDLLTEGSLATGVIDYTSEPPLDLERNLERNHEASYVADPVPDTTQN